MQQDGPTRSLDQVMANTRVRIARQQEIADRARHTAGHEAAVMLLLMLQDILFELGETRKILARVAAGRRDRAPADDLGEIHGAGKM